MTANNNQKAMLKLMLILRNPRLMIFQNQHLTITGLIEK